MCALKPLQTMNQSNLAEFKLLTDNRHQEIGQDFCLRYMTNFTDPAGSWVQLASSALTTYRQDGLTLTLGHRYSVRVAAVNGAGLLSAYETDGVLVDITEPVVSVSVSSGHPKGYSKSLISNSR